MDNFYYEDNFLSLLFYDSQPILEYLFTTISNSLYVFKEPVEEELNDDFVIVEE